MPGDPRQEPFFGAPTTSEDCNGIRLFLARLAKTLADGGPALSDAVARARAGGWLGLRLRVHGRAPFPAEREPDAHAVHFLRRRVDAHQAHAHRPDGLDRAPLRSAAHRRGSGGARPDARWTAAGRPRVGDPSALFHA